MKNKDINTGLFYLVKERGGNRAALVLRTGRARLANRAWGRGFVLSVPRPDDRDGKSSGFGMGGSYTRIGRVAVTFEVRNTADLPRMTEAVVREASGWIEGTLSTMDSGAVVSSEALSFSVPLSVEPADEDEFRIRIDVLPARDFVGPLLDAAESAEREEKVKQEEIREERRRNVRAEAKVRSILGAAESAGFPARAVGYGEASFIQVDMDTMAVLLGAAGIEVPAPDRD